jgi:HK97 gp10 family phage protein
MTTSLRFEGGKALATALSGLSARVSKKLVLEALHEAAEPMRDRMEANAPVSAEAPHLRDVIVVRTSRGKDAKESAVAVGATRGGFYGSFQEFGTAHHAPQPWARPAFDATHQTSLRVFADALWRELAGRGIQRGSSSVDVPVEGEEV